MQLFRYLTPISYWLLIIMWAFILAFYWRRLRHVKHQGGLLYTLLLILSIDAFRTLFESLYFGAWYTAVVGWLPSQVQEFLVQPAYVFVPKSLNVVAAALVIFILLRRWLPQEEAERVCQEEYTRELERRIDERNRMNQRLIELNQELQHLNQLKDKFLGIAAHDLRNPLNIVQGYLALLSEGMVGKISETQREMVHDMDVECQTMLSLINDLLDINAIASGHLEIRWQDIPLAEYLRKCHRPNQILAQRKNITLKLDLPESLPIVRIDPIRIQQVINNLVSNAIKFSPPHSVATLRARRVGEEVHISVQDEGLGIPAEEIPRLFTEFGRTSVKPTSGESSTGLGLAIVKRILDAHGGRIWVESEVGKGSTFTFALRCQPQAS